MYRRRERYNGLQHELGVAFKLMRQQGLVARQAFSCCGGCAGGEIASDVTKMPETKFAKLKGACFYHRQAASDRDRGDNFYISYGQITTNDDRTTPLSTYEVGRIVRECLMLAHVPYEWNGDPTQCFKIVQEDA